MARGLRFNRRVPNLAFPAGVAEQTTVVLNNAKAALDAIGATPADIVQIRIYMTDLRPQTQELFMGPLFKFLDGTQPSITGVGVAALAAPELKLELEMVVRLPE